MQILVAVNFRVATQIPSIFYRGRGFFMVPPVSPYTKTSSPHYHGNRIGFSELPCTLAETLIALAQYHIIADQQSPLQSQL